MPTEYILAIRPSGIMGFGDHDPSAVIFENGDLVFGIEEERLTRQKHATDTFPTKSITACLDFCGIQLSDLNKILVTDNPKLRSKRAGYDIKNTIFNSQSFAQSIYWLNRTLVEQSLFQFHPLYHIKKNLKNINPDLPPIETRSHHACHAASAFHPSEFSEALVITADGIGEYDSTVVWRGSTSGLEREKTFNYPNSLGYFYGSVTEFLGFRSNNGEGKVMGLAPYGDHNSEIRKRLRNNIEISAEYDVTNITECDPGTSKGVANLEKILNRERKRESVEFTQWEKDLAFETQLILEEILCAVVSSYTNKTGLGNVCLAGGVALNCKANKRIMELDCVDNIFIQPVATDAGLPIGAGYLDQNPQKVEPQSTIYTGSEYTNEQIRDLLNKNKISYIEPNDIEKYTAQKIAEGYLIGWFQGRMEMGPRALGNRSILADPRSESSRDRVNKFVKHREEWRPFAPSMTYDSAEYYLKNAEEAPFMIKTFETKEETRNEIEAVIHPSDNTTRPQTVKKSQNERYYNLLSEFENITGVPVLLNTSFNDHGEPIIRTPKEAIRSFFAMGLDTLVLNDIVVEKKGQHTTSD